MLGQQRPKGSMFQMVTIEELVPKDHFLRQLDAAVDFSFIRVRVRHLYCEDNGRPSIDPELALRMFVLSYLYDISENRLCEEITMHAGYRWFCRLDFHDPVPDRTTLVKTRQRWGRAGVFADVMRHVVLACVEAGLVSADVLAVDGTLVKARAATKSLEAIQPPICLEEYLARVRKQDEANHDGDEPPGDNPPAATGSASRKHRKAGDPNFRNETFRNATHRSKTDPDARLYAKGSHQEAKLRYMVHNLMDVRSGVILEACATRCSGTAEREAALEMVRSVKRMGLDPGYLLGDGNYTAGAFLSELLELGVEPLVPIQGEIEPLPCWQRRTFDLDRKRKRKESVEAAKARNHARLLRADAIYERLYPLRSRLEHGFAEGKGCHGLDEARGYGLLAMDIQAKMTAIVQNLKRLVRFKPRRPRGGVLAMAASTQMRRGWNMNTHPGRISHIVHLLHSVVAGLCPALASTS